ncbi:Lipase EstA/Esterase EstB family-containing protein [Strongyloides ratti]|uniref:Lipase EstA/Esterase EstB family-containing protein n=1 Tax=Strongyloides ratti TaxID=34506 RepID=A0A090N0K5_STRRB|nr:Lipase EstA/Esterase EstB family-containing protein [Strongyloides ratti]CEF70848.1 Lipase EstA/Esterase EstB family-containing protein [Strongyloides ratti]
MKIWKKIIFFIFSIFTIKTLQNEGYGPISDNFKYWLIVKNYREDNFFGGSNNEINSFGGKISVFDKINHRPIIFIHGNSDGALSDGSTWGTGWNSHISFFKNSGYKLSELYGITWGNRDSQDPMNITVSCDEVERIRRFIFAVLEYTEYDSVNIIAHSMGVTMARKAIKGGVINGIRRSCNIDDSLLNHVHTFIAISGANYGFSFCSGDSAYAFPACNKYNGFWPGNNCDNNKLCEKKDNNMCIQRQYSKILQDLNENEKKEAKYVFTIFTPNDELLGDNGLVCGNYTSRLPIYDKEIILQESDHMRTKDDSYVLCQHLIAENDLN